MCVRELCVCERERASELFVRESCVCGQAVCVSKLCEGDGRRRWRSGRQCTTKNKNWGKVGGSQSCQSEMGIEVIKLYHIIRSPAWKHVEVLWVHVVFLYGPSYCQ